MLTNRRARLPTPPLQPIVGTKWRQSSERAGKDHNYEGLKIEISYLHILTPTLRWLTTKPQIYRSPLKR